MAPKPKPARFVFTVGMALAMALTILTISRRTAIGLRRARQRFAILNFCFCTKGSAKSRGLNVELLAHTYDRAGRFVRSICRAATK